jgi:hypothetical protein
VYWLLGRDIVISNSEELEEAKQIVANFHQGVNDFFALHACDIAIAWAINDGAKLLLIAPCCRHDFQTQMSQSPALWNLITNIAL